MGYDRDNSGAIFSIPVDKRRQNGPTMSGSVMIGGVKYRLAAWKKEGKNGKPPWLSLAVSDWEERGGNREPGQDEGGF